MNGSPLEWVQFIFAMIALSIQATVWIDAWFDYRWVFRQKDHQLYHEIIALGNVRGETIRLCVSVAFVLVGIFAVSQEPPPGILPTSAKIKLLAIIFASSCVALSAYFSRYDRKRLLDGAFNEKQISTIN